ncbi:uncharacterized protein LOC110037159 [Phalaenopsis equestris]|uniref:uncharacterized protein LOC110037159 n=1 Tax=Phalaenopsis equestris TaxID=78828 RepID=UPI0009E5B991|nr:uncharacterized protein LOC110037159 [Phalaenopsis equestris]
MNRFDDFLTYAGLYDLGYQGPKFTWRRGSMWERLDRLLGNSKWLQTFPFTIISHLAMSGSDHSSLPYSIQNNESPKCSPFRFQNMWTLHPEFLVEIEKVWSSNGGVNPWMNLWHLQKKVAAHLQKWNWNKFGNIHDNLTATQNKVLNLEKGFQRGVNSEIELHRVNEELLVHINFSENFLKQMAAITKFIEGNRNSSFYHACINFKRKCNMILSITDSIGKCLVDADAIAQDAVNYFQNLFNSQPSSRSHINTELLSDC